MKKKLFGFLVISCFIILASPTLVIADEPQWTGFDLIFLVDQSGSMGGSAFRGKSLLQENDINDLRFWGPLLAIDWLGRAYLEQEMSANAYFRVGVIHFGRRSYWAFPDPGFREIAPVNSQAWESKYQDIAEIFSPDALAKADFFSSEELWCCTNFDRTFQSARKLVTDMENQDRSNRLKIIILLSDGLPDPRGEDEYSTSTMTPYMDTLKTFTQENFPYPEYSIHVLAFNDSQHPYWSRVETHWKEITHNQARLVADNLMLGGDLQQTLLDITKPFMTIAEQEIQCGPLVVEPYLSELHFTIHKPIPEARVQIYDASETLLTSSDADTVSPLQVNGQEVWLRGVDTPIESVTIYNPQPGSSPWRLVCPQGQASPPRIFRRSVPAEAHLTLQPGTGQQFVPLELRLELLDYRGAVLSSYQDKTYALELSARARVDDEVSSISFEKVSADTEVYRGWLVPELPVEHLIELECSATKGDGTGVSVTSVRQHVTVKPSRLQVRRDTAMITVGVPITISAGFVDENGAPSPVSVKIPRLSVTMHASHKAEVQSLPMSLSSGVFVTDFTPAQVGEYRIDVSGQFTTTRGTVSEISSTGPMTMSVVPPTITEPDLAEHLVQGRSNRFAVSVSDQESRPWPEVLADGFTPQVEAIVRGKDEQIVPMEYVVKERQFSGTFTPNDVTTHTLDIQIALVDPSGHSTTVLRQTLGSRPTTPHSVWLKGLMTRIAILVFALVSMATVAVIYVQQQNRRYLIPVRLELTGREGQWCPPLRLSQARRRHIIWPNPGEKNEREGWEGFPSWNNRIKRIEVAHMGRELAEDRVIRVDVCYTDRKLKRSNLLMVGDEELWELRDGMSIRLVWDEETQGS